MSNRDFDIVIIGGGPAGLLAAKTVLAESPKVKLALIERSTDYHKSVICGEGVWSVEFQKFLPLKEEWLRFRINQASFHSPNRDGIVLPCDEKIEGYVIDRARMQEDILTEIDTAPSATLFRGDSVSEITPLGTYQKVSLKSGEILTANVVIDASGPASRFGKPFDIYRKPVDFEPAMYALIDNVEQETNKIELHRNVEFGPDGYYWHFPHSETVANVGIVLGMSHKGKVNLRQLLIDSVETFYPNSKILSIHGGAIPNYTTKRPLATDGFIQCGDAAELVNPLTRSGITESMFSGTLAAKCALEMVGTEIAKERLKAAKSYDKSLFKRYGKKMSKAARFKAPFYSIAPEIINKAVSRLRALPSDKMTMARIMRAVVGSSPKLLLLLRHLV